MLQGPHRPYEGSQLSSAMSFCVPELCPHRPYEGSQHHPHDPLHLRRLSSSPLRGVATRPGSVRRGRSRCPHRPYEGSQQVGVVADHVYAGGPHGPYEGSQRERVRFGRVVCVGVLIAPTRSRNRSGSSSTRTSARVLIAPTRGRSGRSCMSTSCLDGRLPYSRGVQQHGLTRTCVISRHHTLDQGGDPLTWIPPAVRIEGHISAAILLTVVLTASRDRRRHR